MGEINIVWVGCHREGVSAYRSLLKKGYKITKFVTLNEIAFSKCSGGSRAYIELCKKYNVPISLISTIKNDEAYEIIKAAHPDLLIVLGWNEILPERLLDIPTIGAVGAHASMLPHNRGSAPVNWALIRGEETSGNSLMWLDKRVDQGKIIDQIPFEITDYDTCKTLYDKVSATNEVMLLRLVERLSSGQSTVMEKENITDEPLLPRRYPKDGLINWNQKNRQVYNFIRALVHPYPGAFSYLNGKKFLLWNASLLADTQPYDNPGKIIGSVCSPVDEACGIQIACSIGSIVIHEIEDDKGMILAGSELTGLGFKGVFANE